MSIKDIMTITNLSERSIRRYLEEGKLEGTKVGGVWRFTEEQLEGFYGEKAAVSKVRKEATQQVLDFINMPNPKKKDARVCTMIDLRNCEETIVKVKQAIMNECSNTTDTMTMKFLKEKDNYRFILIGSLEFVHKVTMKIYTILN
ncbi:MAG: helix-turn-helix domain-containing protein [Firmicutes bacterium]|nr:helix-turn-helix domain-containing protein [Bacillota bacterium]